MKNLIDINEIKYYLYRKRKIYFLGLIFIVIGIILGIVMAVSSDRFVTILKTDDKVLFDFIKGKVSFSSQFSGVLLKFLIPISLLFLFNLSRFTSFFSFAYFSYLGCLFFLNGYAVITEFGFSGVLSFIVLSLPANLLIFAVLLVFNERCYSRCETAKRYKQWSYGLNSGEFWQKNLIVILFGLVCSILIVGFLLLVLESRVFMIF